MLSVVEGRWWPRERNTFGLRWLALVFVRLWLLVFVVVVVLLYQRTEYGSWLSSVARLWRAVEGPQKNDQKSEVRCDVKTLCPTNAPSSLPPPQELSGKPNKEQPQGGGEKEKEERERERDRHRAGRGGNLELGARPPIFVVRRAG